MTAHDIIRQARERLGDEKEQRWTNNRLLSIVSQGQVDICTESGYLRREVIVPLVVNQTRFQLPADCISIKRVEYQGELLPLHTRNDQDTPRATTTDYTAYKSNLNMDRLEIQPAIEELSQEILYVMGEALDDTLYVTPLFGVITSTNNADVTVVPEYGCVTDVEVDIEGNIPSQGYGEIAGSNLDEATVDFPNGEYGVVVEAEYSFTDEKYGFISAVEGHLVSGSFGIISNVAVLEDTFHIFYVAVPSKLKVVSEQLILPVVWEDLLLRYVVGTALQDDNDANNLARGEAELQKYNIKLATIRDMSSKDFSANSSDKNETDFRRI